MLQDEKVMFGVKRYEVWSMTWRKGKNRSQLFQLDCCARAPLGFTSIFYLASLSQVFSLPKLGYDCTTEMRGSRRSGDHDSRYEIDAGVCRGIKMAGSVSGLHMFFLS